VSKVRYISPDFTVIWAEPHGDIVDDDGKCYRQLSPEYLIWLSKHLKDLKVKMEMGQFGTRDYENCQQTYLELREIARKTWGDPLLIQTFKNFPILYEPPTSYLYVSPTLYRWYATYREARDLIIGGVPFRLMDPEYHAFLQKKVESAPEGDVRTQRARARFATIHEECLQRFGKQALDQIYQTIDMTRYRPPTLSCAVWRYEGETYSETLASKHSQQTHLVRTDGFLFPKDGDFAHCAIVPNRVLEKVKAIEETALSLGWSLPHLFQNRSHLAFPYGMDYGLAPFLKEEDQIVQVTMDFIEIKNQLGNLMKFYNPARATTAPWIEPPVIKKEATKPKKRTAAPKGKGRKKKNGSTTMFDGEAAEAEYEV
jgi:hypothetical protein